MKKTLVVLLCLIVGVAISFVMMYFSFNNHNTVLRTAVPAKQKVVEVHFDKMWKIIKQTAQVPQEFEQSSKEAFKDIYIPLMEGRYGDARGGALMSWITEDHPDWDMAALASLYEKVQVVVKSERTDLANRQDQLIDAQRAHIEYMNLRPQMYFLDKRDTIDIKLITSSVAKEAIETGEENDIDLFKKD